MCQYAHHPHPNVLPAMPDRKKGSKGADSGSGGTENGKRDPTEEKVPSLANGPSTVVTSPSDEAGGGVSSEPKECSTVSDDATSS